ncbi:cell division topological specificity factor MinE [Candidatus Pantoea edessiphila]|uniref:Cell division topological specificity factor n=1 Tax=Candidatus Pantoea edessiphila TaxID=2044610 RepID=A0A2P5SWP6_9GAMM|nr:cell division topological specificity factor MinE [Candidatus Pantoea edessiphila]PPI86768.1 cell division topological specificity factor MinE [Candidatus Pantoea edessiphila]
MSLINFFLSKKNQTADIAKERLQILVSETRQDINQRLSCKELKQDILKIICKHIRVDPKMIFIKLDKKDNDVSMFKFSIVVSKIRKNN